QVIRRQMKMAGVGEILEVEVFPAKLGHGSRIRKDIATGFMVEHDRETGLGLAGSPAHSGHISATFFETLERDLPQRVVPDARLKSHAGAKRGEVVGHDSGG